MEKYTVAEDIPVLCLLAKSFPDGVKEAHHKLRAMLPTTEGREFYGISWKDLNGKIIYKAAVRIEESEEAEKYCCDTFIIRRGSYLSIFIDDFTKDKSAI